MGAAIYAIIPGELLTPERKDDVIAFLQQIPAPPRRIKQLYIEWCRVVGAALTREDLEKLLGSSLLLV